MMSNGGSLQILNSKFPSAAVKPPEILRTLSLPAVHICGVYGAPVHHLRDLHPHIADTVEGKGKM
jgi:hypothetical protein